MLPTASRLQFLSSYILFEIMWGFKFEFPANYSTLVLPFILVGSRAVISFDIWLARAMDGWSVNWVSIFFMFLPSLPEDDPRGDRNALWEYVEAWIIFR